MTLDRSIVIKRLERNLEIMRTTNSPEDYKKAENKFLGLVMHPSYLSQEEKDRFNEAYNSIYREDLVFMVTGV